MCVGRPGAAGGDFLPKSDFWAKKLSFCRKWVNYTRMNFCAPGPGGGGVHTFLSHTSKNSEGAKTQRKYFSRGKLLRSEIQLRAESTFCRKPFSQWKYKFPPMAPNHCKYQVKSMLLEIGIADIANFTKKYSILVKTALLRSKAACRENSEFHTKSQHLRGMIS